MHEPQSDDGAVDVASLVKGLAVLESIASMERPPTVASVIADTGLDRSTVNRMLRTLVKAGYLHRHGRGRYGSGHRSFRLGTQLQDRSHLVAAALPVMRDLQASISETVNLGVLDHTSILYVARLATARLLTTNLDVGDRLPAYNSSMGRAILAFLPEREALKILEESDRVAVTQFTLVDMDDLWTDLRRCRSRGYSLTADQMALGLRSIAAPVFANNRVVAAMNVTVTAARFSEHRVLDNLKDPLLDATQRLTTLFTR